MTHQSPSACIDTNEAKTIAQHAKARGCQEMAFEIIEWLQGEVAPGNSPPSIAAKFGPSRENIGTGYSPSGSRPPR